MPTEPEKKETDYERGYRWGYGAGLIDALGFFVVACMLAAFAFMIYSACTGKLQ